VTEGGKPHALLAVSAAAVYVLSRGPLLPLGFGADADVWAVAANSRLLLSGHYAPSRFPGHPLHEALFALPMAAGPRAANTVNLALSLAVLVLTFLLARRWSITAPRVTVLLLAVQPLFWIASADSTDFMLATALALSALYAAVCERPRLGGVLLGLAAGARIECLAFALPLLWLQPRARLRMAALTAATVALLYLPVLTFYLFRSPPVGDLVTSRLGPRERVLHWLVGLWAALGLVPALALAALVARARRRIGDTVRVRQAPAVVGLLLAAAYALLTLAHPGKAAYYVPALPPLLLALSSWVEPRGRLILAAAFASYAFVYPDVVDRDARGVHLVLRANNGLLAKDVVSRVNMAGVSARVDEGRPRTGVVVLGYWLDAWRRGHPEARRVDEVAGVTLDRRHNAAWRAPDGTVMVHTLSAAEAAQVLARHVPLACGEGIDAFEREARGVDLVALGATPVPVRLLGEAVAERFVLPDMIGCLAAPPPWTDCVRARAGAR